MCNVNLTLVQVRGAATPQKQPLNDGFLHEYIWSGRAGIHTYVQQITLQAFEFEHAVLCKQPQNLPHETFSDQHKKLMFFFRFL